MTLGVIASAPRSSRVTISAGPAVTSNPAGIACTATCVGTYPVGTQVTLTTAAASGSTFALWTGACQGSGSCTIGVSASANVTAVFAVPGNYAVGVNVTGTGTVTANGGINCTQSAGPACGANFPNNTLAVLTATPPSDGSTFAGWSGDCSSAGNATTCTLTNGTPHSVGALFLPPAQ